MRLERKNIIWILFGAIATVSLYLVFVLIFWLSHKDEIYPGVTVAGVSLSGKNRMEAEKALNDRVDEYQNSTYTIGEKRVSVKDFGIEYNVPKTVSDSLALSEQNPFFLGKKKNITMRATYDVNALYKSLGELGDGGEGAVVNARVKRTAEGFELVPGVSQNRINYAESELRFKESIINLRSYDPAIFKIDPTFSELDLSSRVAELNALNVTGLKLSGAGRELEVSAETIFSWLQIKGERKQLVAMFEGEQLLAPIFDETDEGSAFSSQEINSYLKGLSKGIDTGPVNAKLSIKDGRAAVFTPSKDGQKLDVEKSTEKVLAALERDQKSVQLVVSTVKPEITEESLNNFGINELLSSGYSDFKGSPENRKHNIKTGASKFNGILVKPGDSFSFNKILGPVDASTGYLPELVILENKTEPQFGGGLCQVSSTAFRAALNAGLPILERKAHAYPVVYYKPYGVDASIYLPKPDFVFRNDTGKYILIQTRVEGTRLHFDFYGTKPARTVKFGGNENASAAVDIVEKVTPLIYDQEARGPKSFSATFWRFVYDGSGKLMKTDKFNSKYDSPDKYPH